MAERAEDDSFVEEPLNCELEDMPHHGGGEVDGVMKRDGVVG